MIRNISSFFDKLEDKVRGHLSRYPILYAFIGGVGVVLFWRGVWHIADVVPILSNAFVSITLGTIILLVTGVFVSAFVGSRLILTGLRGEKKATEKTQEELEEEEMRLSKIQTAIHKVEEEIEQVHKEIKHYNNIRH
jgi:hypothetical protein